MTTDTNKTKNFIFQTFVPRAPALQYPEDNVFGRFWSVAARLPQKSPYSDEEKILYYGGQERGDTLFVHDLRLVTITHHENSYTCNVEIPACIPPPNGLSILAGIS
jgi:hypothetical protein